MKRTLVTLFAAAIVTISAQSWAHHSFAIYDMTQNFEFTGVVETVKLRNPHMALTLIHTKEDGTKETITFVEGAPANMIVRLGLKPEMIAPGQTITTIGSPRKDNPNAYFLKTIILPDGQKFQILN